MWNRLETERRRFQLPVSLLGGIWVYLAVIILQLLYFHNTLPPPDVLPLECYRLSLLLASPWARAFRWLLLITNSLLVTLLWLRYRMPSVEPRWPRLAAHVGTALLVLAVHWAWLHTLAAIPQFAPPVQIHP
jgi:hypothetical protein